MKKLVFLLVIFLISFSFKSSEGIEVKWDFSKYKKITYSYHQVMIAEPSSIFDEKMQLEGNGIIELQILDSVQAKLNIIVKDFKSYKIDSSGKLKNEETLSPFDLEILGIEEDNINNFSEYTDANFIFRTIFPVVKNKIELNQNLDYPLSIHAVDNGQSIKYKGSNFLKLKSITNEIGLLELYYDLSKTDETTAEIKFSVKGKSEVKYDCKNQYFSEGKAEMTMEMGEKKQKDSEMKLKNLIEYKLISVE